MTQHFVLRPFTEVIYDQSLRRNVNRVDLVDLFKYTNGPKIVNFGQIDFFFWNLLFFHVESEFLVSTSF